MPQDAAENYLPSLAQAPGTSGTPHAHCQSQCRIPPKPPDGPTPFDHTVNALIDHLMVIEDRFLQIEDALLATAAEFTAVKTLVEELLP
jgi:hypothetical protein